MKNELIAKTFQGLEPLLARELTELGADDIQIGRRMVTFSGDKEMMYKANFCLRTAIRILKPIKRFKARSADDVYEAVKAIDWSEYLTPQTTFAVDSVVFSEEFTHSKFVAYKVKDAIADQFRERSGNRPNVSVSNPDIQLHIHIAEDDATLALDSSGESLHRRGYRTESVAAPLNEVLAAGIIMMTGWQGECDFIDPMCGSGTFAIEAALIACGIMPGVFRKEFAFEKWPDFDKELFESIFDDDSHDREFTHHIYARDVDAKAVGIALRNVRAAGLTKYITVEMQDFKDFKKPFGQAIMVMNPPYGERISSPDLLGLYKMIGTTLKHEFAGGEAWVLSYREECFDEIGLKPSLKTPLYNGSLECELRKYVLFSGRLEDHRATGGTVKTDEERRQMADKHRFKQKREFKRRFDDDDEEGLEIRPRRFSDEGDERHRYNKYSRREGDGERRRFRRDDDGDERGGRESRFGRGGRRTEGRKPYGREFRRDDEGRPSGREFRRDDERGSRSHDYRPKGANREARQESRRKFFGGGKRDR
ncbi:MAG: RNA methyltransferase [Bacteroidaceae bacterium]|nr:RNA methyltransferase [Bacteroidaceae bacterium]